MKELIHDYKGNKVRTKQKGDKIMFCAVDVGKILGITDVQRQARKFPKGVITSPTLTKGGMQNIMYIDEGNLYRLIFKSRKKEAIEFQDWVLDEVLPTIRKTGQYSIPKTLIDKSKKDFSKEEIALLSALEAMETLNLMVNPAYDYYSCKDSLYKTSDKIKAISEPKEKKEID